MPLGAVIRTPRYLPRRRLALRALRGLPPSRILEVGCGTGELIPHLVRRGHAVVGYDTSSAMVALASAERRSCAGQVRITGTSDGFGEERFDCLLALEVLEHIEDDLGSLKLWRSWLKPGGLIVLSVPAHMRNWTPADDAGGHYRRYERRDLSIPLGTAGFVVERSWNFGFPLTVITVPARRLLYSMPRSGNAESRTAMSALDSVRRLPVGGKVAEWANEALGAMLHWCQLPFMSSELGDGYMMSARTVPVSSAAEATS